MSAPVTAPTSSPVAVVGATGQQGGAVARALLARSATVRALVRDPDSDRAAALADAGAALVTADLQDPASLRRAFDGVAAVFAMTTMTGGRGTRGEVEDGRAIADAALAAGVPYLVYSSVGGAERDTGIPHFESKWQVEQYLRGQGVPTVVVRPTFFYENLPGATSDAGDGSVLGLPLPDGVALQMVAVETIGAVAATLLLDRPLAPGEAVEIAGDELTGSAMAAAIATATGRPVRYQAAPLDVLGDDEDMRAMFAWFTHLPAYRADVEATRRYATQVPDLASWATGHRDAF